MMTAPTHLLDLCSSSLVFCKNHPHFNDCTVGQTFCDVPVAESEGTLILPHLESSHRLQDDDATTISSEDSFFSAAEVRSFYSALCLTG